MCDEQPVVTEQTDESEEFVNSQPNKALAIYPNFQVTFCQLNLKAGKKMRQVILHRGEDGYWVAECPGLPGCISQGKTKEQAIRNIKEAIEGYIAALAADGLPVPEEHFETLVIAV